MSPSATRPDAERAFLADFGLAALVAVVTTLPYLMGGYFAGGLAQVGGVAMAASLMVRRLLPPLALATGVIGALLTLLGSVLPTVGIVAVPVLIYSLARWGTPALANAGLALGLGGALLGPVRWALAAAGGVTTLIYLAMGVVGCGSVVLVAYVVGRRRRESVENRQHRQSAEAERRRLQIAEQEQRAEVATVAERTRIARELHDIVAHSLSVIVVQAEGGRALASKQPERGPEVLGTIAETSRQALEEMRRMVGLLRSGQPAEVSADYLPSPGLAEIDELVRRTSERAELAVFGTPPEVGPALALTAYRLVQESLTNVLKHAGPTARARVTLAYTPQAVEIEVADDGRGAAAQGDGGGHGLQGMQERVALHGGSLTAGPRPVGGFAVRATLPLVDQPRPNQGGR